MGKLPLKLGLLGYNMKLTKEGLKYFRDNNEEQIYSINWSSMQITLEDGTIIEAIPNVDERSLRGKSFDQLILFDDERWSIMQSRDEDIDTIRNLTMRRSFIPEEFQIIKLENKWEAES